MSAGRPRSAYMSGPLSGLARPDEVKAFYEAVAAVCAEAGISLYLPHKVSDPIANPSLPPAQVYAMDRACVAASDLVIAYVGLPSLGVGSELEIAHEYGVPILLMAEQTADVSRMARGNPSVVAELRFADYPDCLNRLAAWLADRGGRRIITTGIQ